MEIFTIPVASFQYHEYHPFPVRIKYRSIQSCQTKVTWHIISVLSAIFGILYFQTKALITLINLQSGNTDLLRDNKYPTFIIPAISKSIEFLF